MSNSSSFAIPTGNLYDISHIMQMPPEATSTLDIIQKAIAVGTSGLGSFGLTGALTSDLIGINAESTIITKYIDSANRIDFIIFLSTSSSGKNFTIGTIDTDTSVVTINYSNEPSISNKYVLKTGDTMTGDLTVKTSSANVTETDTSHNGSLWTGFGSGHQNHGLYSEGYAPSATTWTNDAKWMVYRDSSGNVNLNGNATTATNATNATKLSTARNIAFGADLQGNQNFDGSSNIAINARITRCLCDSQNVSNYPWHRIATVTMGTSSWQDGDCILEIRHRYSSGPCGRIKISCRTNNATSSQAANVVAQWIYRKGISENAVVIALWGNSGQNVYADVYYNVATYARCIISKPYSEGPHEFQLINSSEANDTTTSDKKGSYECYKTVAIAATELRGQAYTSTYTAVDAAVVSASGSATNATNIYAKSGSYKTVANTLLEMVYPVGSVYISTKNTSPATFLGGTWTTINGRFLLGLGSNTANTTTAYGSLAAGAINRTTAKELGGEVSHTLTTTEMPKHTHTRIVRVGASAGSYYGYPPSSSNSGTESNQGGVSEVGGSGAHNNMPPYIAVYMWERTA